MNQRFSAPARALAATALVCGFVVVIVIVATSLGGGGDGGGSRGEGGGGQATTRSSGGGGKRRAPKAYVVKSGDTLSSIARKTGVSVARIIALNPGVDPQILISGEKLKLR
jgi:hypothetical protein